MRAKSSVAAMSSLALWLAVATCNAADLLGVYRAAQTQDPLWGSAKAAYQASLEKASQSSALFLPSIDASAGMTKHNVDFTSHDTSLLPSRQLHYDANYYAVTLTQPLYRPQNLALYRQSSLELERSEVSFKLEQQALLLRVAKAYFDVLLAIDAITFSNAESAAVSKELALARRKLEVGTGTAADVKEAQARYDLVTAEAMLASNLLQLKRHALAKITGTYSESVSVLNDSAELPAVDQQDVDQWIDIAKVRNYQIRSAKQSVEIANAALSRHRYGHLPTLDLVGTYTRSQADSSLPDGVGNDTAAGVVGIQLRMPLYSGGAQHARVREAAALLEKTGYEESNVERVVVLETRQAFLGVAHGAAQVRAFEQAVVSAEESLNSARRGYQVGTRTISDVLASEQQLYSAKRGLAQSRVFYLTSYLELHAAAGQLEESHLAAINALLEESSFTPIPSTASR